MHDRHAAVEAEPCQAVEEVVLDHRSGGIVRVVAEQQVGAVADARVIDSRSGWNRFSARSGISTGSPPASVVDPVYTG